MGEALRVLDLFSAAAGGWSLGLHRAGFRTVAAAESIEWRRALYAQNNPGVLIYDDVRTLTADRIVSDLGYLPDIVVGSPPCQDISSANTKGRGVEGERSGLYFEAVRIIGEVRPRWFSLENSANLRTRGADAVLAALEALGYTCWTFVVRASDVGANHERARSWIIGCDPEQIANANGVGRRARPGDSQGADAGLNWCVAGDDYGDGAAPDAHGDPIRVAELSRGAGEEAPFAGNAHQVRNTSDPDQARQAHGCVEPGLRQAELADDGCGAGRCDDGSRAAQMGLCSADRGAAVGGGPLWSLANLADHLWLDAGLSARVADTRIDLGTTRGISAARLIVEAFGDAVVPQIPEAIGRAILRVEAAMMAVAA